MHAKSVKAVACVILFAAILVASTGLLAAKARLAPHQLTIFFAGDDWGKYKFCA